MSTIRTNITIFYFFNKKFQKHKNALIFTILVECGWLRNSFFRFGFSRNVSNYNSIDSYRVQKAGQIDISVKTVFLTQGVSKRKNLMKIPKVIFHIKPIPSHMMRM